MPAPTDTILDGVPAAFVPTERQIALVRHTFDLIAPIAGVVADLFYERLFYLVPSLRRMFPHDMAGQKRSLMVVIATTVQNLDNLDALVPLAKGLGARHARYGVTAAQYAVAGDVLMWALERGLANAFTGEVEEAWRRTFGLITAAMQAGAHELATLQAAE